MLNQAKHAVILKNILRDIYQHPQLQTQLAFKGGTCLFFFHDLPRFSVDLDFSFTSQEAADTFDPTAITTILRQYLTLTDETEKRFTWFWLGSYEKGLQQIKVEISKRPSPLDQYSVQNLLGVSVRALDLPSMFAHKLVAVSQRRVLVNRDLFDAWWFLKKMIPIRAEIIMESTGQTIPEYLGYLLTYIPEHTDRKHILAGLGELLDRSQKDWVRSHLLDELLAQLQLRKEAEEKTQVPSA